MSTGKRIDFSLFDDSLKNLINASAKIFPVDYTYITSNTNPMTYEYVRCVTDGHKNEIYVWDSNVWKLIGADDFDVKWDDVKYKPTSFVPSIHTHDQYALGTHNHDNTYQPIGSYASSTHTHIESDVVGLDKYTKSEIDGKLILKADTNHDHNGAYYTKSEVSTMVGGKADLGHNHNSSYAVKSIEAIVASNTTRLDNIEGGYTEGHSHANLTTLNGITDALITAWNSAVSHISDVVRHITSAERTLWNTVSSKADVSTLTSHTDDSTIHVTSIEKTNIGTITGKADKSYVDTQLASKTDSSTFTGHTGNTTVHVLQTDKDSWNGKTKITQGTVQPSTGFWFKEV